MRSGFATSACASAAASAAVRALITGEYPAEVVIDLPTVRNVRFALARCEPSGDGVLCGVIKDAGDDPDVTDGLEIQALAERGGEPGLELTGGDGVGVVTLPGLPCAVGEPAINPGPRRLIRRVVEQTLRTLGEDPALPLRVTVRVPDGERVALQTMNPKLGIIGGISILGTDGLVRPYSAPAFRASIFYEMRVAVRTGRTVIGLATGKRSSAYLAAHLDDPAGAGVVDVGDELGFPLLHAARLGASRVVFGGMIGKMSKLAQGRFHTHVAEGEVDFEFLASVAAGAGAPAELCGKIRTARTAHQVQGWLDGPGIRIEGELAQRAARHAATEARLPARVVIFTLDGRLLADADALPGEDPA